MTVSKFMICYARHVKRIQFKMLRFGGNIRFANHSSKPNCQVNVLSLYYFF